MNKNYLLCLLAAMIWGLGFLAQSDGMNYVGPWTFNCLRSLIAAVFLFAIMPLLDRIQNTQDRSWDKPVLKQGGVAMGLALAAASMCQQYGILYTDVIGKAGFLSSLYVVLVPVLSLLLGKHVKKSIWICEVMAAAALYFLSGQNSGLHLARGDFFLILCALLFAVHITVIDHYASSADGARLSCLQFLTAGLVCLIPMLVLEKPSLTAIGGALKSVLYAGIFSSGVAYTCQILGQRRTDPAAASLILSLESVFSAVFGYLFLHQTLQAGELLGCALMFAAVVLAQLPEKKPQPSSSQP